MAGIKQLLFDPANLYSLLVHYTDGECPLAGEVQEILVHPALQRFVALKVRSDEWTREDPLHIRYEGQRTLSWVKGQEHDPWKQKNETPKRQ
jgi:hypothetical protein